MIKILVAMALLLTAAVPASADIQSVIFLGRGRITFSDYALAAPVGTPVTVSGLVNFGDLAPVDDRFSGTIPISNFGNNQSYYFNVDGSGIYGDQGGAYGGGFVTLHRGRVTAVSLYADYDNSIYQLGANSFYAYTGFHSASGEIFHWGGTWTMVPEPQSWALLVVGFVFAGSALRRRRMVLSASAPIG